LFFAYDKISKNKEKGGIKMDEIEDILSEINHKEENDTNTVVDNETKSEESQEERKESPKKIEVITGNGDLTISPVREHLEVEKPKPKENRKIFIPEVKKKKP